MSLNSGALNSNIGGITQGMDVIDTNLLRSMISANVPGFATVAPCVVTVPKIATLIFGSASAAGVSTIGAPPANSNLRKLVLSVTELATQVTAGENLITIVLNGNTIFSEGVYIPASSLAVNGTLYQREITFDHVVFNTGALGTLTATIANALTAGALYVNAYFD